MDKNIKPINTKEDLARAVTSKIRISQENAKLVYNAIVEVLHEAVNRDGKIRMPGIGTFTKTERVFHNPVTDTAETANMILFRQSSTLKKSVKG